MYGQAPGPDGVVCGYHCDAWSVSDQCPIHSSAAAKCQQMDCIELHKPLSHYCATHFKEQHGIEYAEVVPTYTDEQIVERVIDFTEELGMVLEPWQATTLRAILLHGDDVAIGLPRQHL